MQACNKIRIASVAVHPSHPRIDLVEGREMAELVVA
jgi:hypothetical protein